MKVTNPQNKKYWIIIGIISIISLILLGLIISGIVLFTTYKNDFTMQLIIGLLIGVDSFLLFLCFLNMGLIFVNNITLKEDIILIWQNSINRMKQKIEERKKQKELNKTTSLKDTTKLDEQPENLEVTSIIVEDDEVFVLDKKQEYSNDIQKE